MRRLHIVIDADVPSGVTEPELLAIVRATEALVIETPGVEGAKTWWEAKNVRVRAMRSCPGGDAA